VRPPIQYFGAKGNLADKLVAMMPPHRGYNELFDGWTVTELKAFTGNGVESERNEVVWSNFATDNRFAL
jgi:hypothetical protein